VYSLSIKPKNEEKMIKTEKKKRLSQIVERLKEIYPNAECALNYGGDPWKLLVMGRLSAQCTDARVNIVCEELFKKFPTVYAMADGNITEIEEIIKPCGLYRMKADNIKAASKMLIDDFGGVLPDNMEDLLKLPGVGRKIANLLLGEIFDQPGVIIVDTHCIRLANRMGFVSEKDPKKIETELRKVIPPNESLDFCHAIVFHGRQVCSARNPDCNNCTLNGVCKKYI
jgi:endonuclease-3